MMPCRLFAGQSLAAVVQAWPDLLTAVRAGIVTMVKAARGDTK
jgi:hypothetical protein